MTGGLGFTTAQKNEFTGEGICDGCAKGRLTMQPMRRREPRQSTSSSPVEISSLSDEVTSTYRPGYLVFADIMFSPVAAIHSQRTMALVLVDAASRYVWTYPMFQKSEAPDQIKIWASWMSVKGITIGAITKLRFDADSVFTGQHMASTLIELKITNQFSAPYSHVPTVERAIRTLQDRVRCMLYHANCPLSFWEKALQYASFLLNRLTCQSNVLQTRYERLLGCKPNISKLRVFGCIVYCRIYDELRKKWDARAFRGRFTGIDEARNDHWQVFNLTSKNFHLLKKCNFR